MNADGNRFVMNLYGALRRREENLFFSPVSIREALGMLLVGAGGDTRAEMEAMLNPVNQVQADDTRVLEATVEGVERQSAEVATASSAFRSANALWAAADIALEAAFVDKVRRGCGALVASLDFSDAAAARERINAWASAETDGRIRELIGRGGLTSSSRLVLTNAVHFKAAWLSPFPAARTERHRFRCQGGGSVLVDMMRVTRPMRLAEDDGVRLLTIPYGDGRSSMVIVLPNEVDGLEAVEVRLDADVLESWLRTGRTVPVALSLPRFESESSVQLKGALRKLGMKKVFEAGADLRGIAPEPLLVDDVIHKSFVRVDEEGTEAAAATAVLVPRGGSMASTAVPFVADHPFLYIVRNDGDGQILFMGRMARPAAVPGVVGG